MSSIYASPQRSKSSAVAPLAGFILMFAAAVIALSIVGSVISTLNQSAESPSEHGDSTTRHSNSAQAIVEFEQIRLSDSRIGIEATLIQASDSAVEVRIVGTGIPETGVWDNPSDDAYYQKGITFGEEVDGGLRPGDTIRVEVYDGQNTYVVQEYTVD